jgi:hypothetical protein
MVPSEQLFEQDIQPSFEEVFSMANVVSIRGIGSENINFPLFDWFRSKKEHESSKANQQEDLLSWLNWVESNKELALKISQLNRDITEITLTENDKNEKNSELQQLLLAQEKLQQKTEIARLSERETYHSNQTVNTNPDFCKNEYATCINALTVNSLKMDLSACYDTDELALIFAKYNEKFAENVKLRNYFLTTLDKWAKNSTAFNFYIFKLLKGLETSPIDEITTARNTLKKFLEHEFLSPNATINIAPTLTNITQTFQFPLYQNGDVEKPNDRQGMVDFWDEMEFAQNKLQLAFTQTPKASFLDFLMGKSHESKAIHYLLNQDYLFTAYDLIAIANIPKFRKALTRKPWLGLGQSAIEHFYAINATIKGIPTKKEALDILDNNFGVRSAIIEKIKQHDITEKMKKTPQLFHVHSDMIENSGSNREKSSSPQKVEQNLSTNSSKSLQNKKHLDNQLRTAEFLKKLILNFFVTIQSQTPLKFSLEKPLPVLYPMRGLIAMSMAFLATYTKKTVEEPESHKLKSKKTQALPGINNLLTEIFTHQQSLKLLTQTAQTLEGNKENVIHPNFPKKFT